MDGGTAVIAGEAVAMAGEVAEFRASADLRGGGTKKKPHRHIYEFTIPDIGFLSHYCLYQTQSAPPMLIQETQRMQ